MLQGMQKKVCAFLFLISQDHGSGSQFPVDFFVSFLN